MDVDCNFRQPEIIFRRYAFAPVTTKWRYKILNELGGPIFLSKT